MPIVGWLCPACSREVPLDHFESGPCRFIVHPDYAKAQLADRRAHEKPDGLPSVTMALNCPRSNAIQKAEPYHIDPLSLNAPATGTAWHAWIDTEGEENEVDLRGTIAGIELTGKTDRLERALLLIEDHKHTNDFGVAKIKKNGAKQSYVLQLSLYAELCEQTFGWRPTQGVIWYHSSLSGKDALLPIRVELLSLHDALVARPHDGTYTVAELLVQASKPSKDWRELPLAGETQMFGEKNLCSYCSVRDICWTQERGAPF